MKKIIGLLCLISFFIFSQFSCKKQKLDEGELEYLVGNWTWQSAEYYNGSSTFEIENQSSKGTNNKMKIEKKGCITLFENGKKKKKYRITTIYTSFLEFTNKWQYHVFLSGDIETNFYYYLDTGLLEVSGFFLIEGDGLTNSITTNHFYK